MLVCVQSVDSAERSRQKLSFEILFRGSEIAVIS